MLNDTVIGCKIAANAEWLLGMTFLKIAKCRVAPLAIRAKLGRWAGSLENNMPYREESMSAKQYQRAVAGLNLSVWAAGRVLGISHRQSLRYSVGGGVPLCIRRLLEMLRDHGVPEDWRKP